MQNEINLSLVITTRNKLQFLKITMERLLGNISADEEIIVIDGSSTDGSAQYLAELYKKGLIHQYVSEPDKCQAEGTNKGLLMAKGRIIKILTDDDAYCLSAIKQCKEFMLNNPDIDVLVGNVADRKSAGEFVCRDSAQINFEKWLKNKCNSFWFGDQGIFLRRSRLPLIGLWHTGVVCLDVEMSVKLTSLRQVKIAWFTGMIACCILNRDSTTLRTGHSEANGRDVMRVFDFYDENRNAVFFNTLRSLVGKIFFVRFLYLFFQKCVYSFEKRKILLTEDVSVEQKFKMSDMWMNKFNSEKKLTFIS